MLPEPRAPAQKKSEFFRYLPVSERDEQWGLYVTAGGFNAIGPGDDYPRPGHPTSHALTWSRGRVLSEYQTLFISRGAGEFESQPTGCRRVSAGSVILLFPGVWHRYRPVSEIGWREYWVSYNGAWPRRWVEQGFLSPDEPVLRVGKDKLLGRAYRRLLWRLRVEPAGFQQLLAASLMEILAAVLGAVSAQGSGSRTHELVRQAKSFLETRTDGVPTIDQLAASLGLSTRQLYRIFRQHTGLSPYRYHLQLRIERAKRLLHGTSTSVQGIADALGFESPFNFSKVFKQKTGMSPSQWRRGERGERRDERDERRKRRQ
jgi:AraC-like DNA-binding protein